MTPRITKRQMIAALAAAAAPALPGARAQGTDRVLRYALSAMPNVIDPHFSTGFQVRDITYIAFDTLFGTDERYAPRPQMVDTWTVSEDRLTWRFTLRDGLRWHDGPPVTAEECVLSIRRWSARDAMGGLLRAATERMAALDARSFEIVLKEPFAFVLEALGKPGSNVPAMLPKRLAELPPTQPVRELIGSGPFRYLPRESMVDQRLVFERNPDYVPRAEPPSWTAGGKVVKVDRLEIHAIPEAATQLNALLTGQVDYIERVAPDLMPLVRRQGRGRIELLNRMPVQLVVRVNHLQPPFDNLAVRRAFQMALDPQEVVDAAAGDPEFGRPCRAVFGCGNPYDSDAGAPAHDLPRARALLATSGADLSRPVVQLHVANASSVTATGEVVTQTLRSLGLTVDQQVVDFPTFAQRRLKMGPVSEGGWNVANTTVGTSELANPLLAQTVAASGPSAWWGWPSDPEIEALRHRFGLEADPARRRALAVRIQERVYEQVITLPAGEQIAASARRSSLRGAIEAPAILFWNIKK